MDLNGNYKSLKSLTILLLVILGFACSSCKKEEPSIIGGSFTFQNQSFSINSVRYDHIGFNGENRHIIRFVAMPGTCSFKYANGSFSGYGSFLEIFVSADDRFLSAGNEYLIAEDSDSTLSALIAFSESDTTYHFIDNASISVDTVYDSNSKKLLYKFVIRAISGSDSITASYIGSPISNVTVDQIGFGNIEIDTITKKLSKPFMRNWGNLFSSSFYHELTFFSTDARYNDKGNITTGLQFVIGINTLNSSISSGKYPVSYSYDGNSTLYGHKQNTTPWGTYWQMLSNQSSTGKANVISDTLTINNISEDNISISFKFSDQLKNTITGSYNGPYYINK